MLQFEQRTTAAEEDKLKADNRLESEIVLRINFEQKINHLHFVNDTTNSTNKLLKEQLENINNDLLKL